MLNKLHITKVLIFTFCFGFLLASPSILPVGNSLSGEVYAQDTLEQQTMLLIVLCNVLNFITGTMGRTLASLIVIAVGFGFFTGKLSWGTMIATALGIAVLFGAPTIINMITGEEGENCPIDTITSSDRRHLPEESINPDQPRELPDQPRELRRKIEKKVYERLD